MLLTEKLTDFSFHFISRDGHASIVKALIEAKADVQVVNTKTNESPLHFAVQYRGKVVFFLRIVNLRHRSR